MTCKKNYPFTVEGGEKEDNALGNVIEKKYAIQKKRGSIAPLMYYLVKDKKIYYYVMGCFPGII